MEYMEFIPFVGIAAVFGPILILAGGLTYYIVKKAQSKTIENSTLDLVANLQKRMTDLESRMNDLQDIVITVDERLKRESGT